MRNSLIYSLFFLVTISSTPCRSEGLDITARRTVIANRCDIGAAKRIADKLISDPFTAKARALYPNTLSGFSALISLDSTESFSAPIPSNDQIAQGTFRVSANFGSTPITASDGKLNLTGFSLTVEDDASVPCSTTGKEKLYQSGRVMHDGQTSYVGGQQLLSIRLSGRPSLKILKQ